MEPVKLESFLLHVLITEDDDTPYEIAKLRDSQMSTPLARSSYFSFLNPFFRSRGTDSISPGQLDFFWLIG